MTSPLRKYGETSDSKPNSLRSEVAPSKGTILGWSRADHTRISRRSLCHERSLAGKLDTGPGSHTLSMSALLENELSLNTLTATWCEVA